MGYRKAEEILPIEIIELILGIGSFFLDKCVRCHMVSEYAILNHRANIAAGKGV